MDAAKVIGELIDAYLGEESDICNNGDFETGDLTGWNHHPDWTYATNEQKHSGNYGCYVGAGCEAGYLNQTILNKLKKVTFWAKHFGYISTDAIKFEFIYEDESTSTVMFEPEYDTWTECIAYPTPGKVVTMIKFTPGSDIPFYIDDVSIIALKSIVKYDEFDPKDPALQILIENYPERSYWVARGVYRIEHRVRITIYLKLVRYEPETIESSRTTWYSLKSNINDLLAKHKYNLPGIVNLDMPGGWNDFANIAVGRGIKTVTEPIIWRSEQEVTAIYYIKQTLVVE